MRPVDAMQQAIRQLCQVRRVGRALLLLQRLMQWSAALLVGLLLAGLLDYALRLPGWLRLGLGLGAALVAVAWLALRLAMAARFNPPLSALALRAERLAPELAGLLASGVEFSAHADRYREPPTTAALAQATVDRARQHLAQPGSFRARHLIRTGPTLRVGVALGAVVATASLVAWAAPGPSRLALRRWLDPLAAPAWPRRTELHSLVDAEIWPDDTPLPLEVRVLRGYRRQMRVWAVCRLLDADGQAAEPTRLLLTEQQADAAPGARSAADAAVERRFTRLLDPGAERAGSGRSPRGSALALHFEAADDRTPDQTIRLVARPAAHRVDVRITPPTYATALVAPQVLSLDLLRDPLGDRGLTVSALVGAQVELRFLVSGIGAPDPGHWHQVLPGLADQPGARFGFEDDTIVACFVLRHTVQTRMHLVDAHGLSDMSERVYRVEAIEDQPPAVSMVEPDGDHAVLPTALVDLAAAARDDVGVERLRLEAQLPSRLEPGSAAGPVRPLQEAAGRQLHMEVRQELDLAALALEVGDTLGLYAVAADGFELDGQRHEPVRSAVRTLRLIDAASLIRQLRAELAGLRQQVIRLDGRQHELMARPAEDGAASQQELGERVSTQGSLVVRLQRQLEGNRATGDAAERLGQLLARSGQLLDQAAAAAGQAAEILKQAQGSPPHGSELADQARHEQEMVREHLGRLAALLDEGDDALALQLQLQQLAARQTELAAETRQLLPHTLGRDPEQLPADQRRLLAELAQRQKELAGQGAELTSRMQSTSELLARQSQEPHDQAAAVALGEAAAIAQRQGLQQKMEQAAEQSDRNRLADAGQAQRESLDTLDQMLAQLRQQDANRQQILRRHLAELAAAIRSLIGQQDAQLARLAQAVDLGPLAEPLSALWRNTLALGAQAAGAAATQPAAAPLAEAAAQQSLAISALRADSGPQAEDAERQARARLQDALDLVERMQEELQRRESLAQRTQLQEAYRALARQQRDLRRQTEPYTALKTVSRRQHLEMARLGQTQADLRNQAGSWRQKTGPTLVFEHLHERIDQTATAVADRLRRDDADIALLGDQDLIAAMLEAMADALEPGPRDDTFAGADGGGGGGGGGQPPLVPPVAELRLLRAVQDSIYQRTRGLIAGAAQDPDQVRPQLEGLALEQRQLAGVGQQWLERQQPRNRLQEGEQEPP